MRKCVYALLCIVGGILLPGSAGAIVNADFTANITSGCAPILVQFTDQSTGNPTTWLWNLGNGTTSTQQNPSTTYILPGTYTVTLTVSNATSSNVQVMTNYITVVALPQVGFIANDTTTTCPPKVVQFTNLSILGTAGAGNYLWDFGDGTTSTLTNPSHVYANSGSYNVTLSAGNSGGCSNVLTKTQYINVAPKPTANFTAPVTGSCSSPLTVNFNNNSTGGNSYSWDFGDGGTSAANNPTHNYTSAGAYDVTLVVTNSAGCKDTIVKPAFVSIGNLSAAFTSSTSSACTNNPVIFTNTSLPGPGNSFWNFGDGSSSGQTNPSHSYSSPGSYNVRLIVQFANCTDTVYHTINVSAGPTPQFTATNNTGCSVPMTVSFNNNTAGSNTYQWFFGDGTSSAQANPNHTYTALGTYTVTLVATSANGCKDSLIMPAFVDISAPAVTISANPTFGCAPATVSFNVNSASPITSYNWTFGAGPGSTAASPNHTYNNPGTYTVTLSYTTASGCTGTKNKIITLGTQPTASFTANPTTLCPNLPVTFTNNSTGAPGTTYTWFFGDGGTSTATNPTHTYNGQGTYTVTLVAYNNGCSDTLTFTNMITVLLPKALFAADVNCVNRKKVVFTDFSLGANTWLWDFGDGTTSTQQNPTHIYASFGTYFVSLTVTNTASGCTSTKTIGFVLFDLQSQFTANDTTICKGTNVVFTASATPEITTYNWNFGDGTSGSSANHTISHVYNAPGSYTVRLIVTDVYNCTDTLIKTNYIKVGGPTIDFDGLPTSGCAPLTVHFTDQTNANGLAITSRQWQFGDGTTSGALNPNHTFTIGTYSVTLVETDALGCSDSLEKINYISASKPDAGFTASDTTICPGQSVSFTNTSAGNNLTYNWAFGDGGTSTNASPNHVYALSGNYTVRLIATDVSGCKDTLIRTNYIHVSSISLGFTMSDSFATCPPLTVNFTNTSTGVNNFTWTFGNGNTSTLASPTTVFTLPGVYTVKLKGQNGSGCKDSVTHTVTVLGPTGTLSYSPIAGCAPLTVSFTSTNTNTQQLIWDMNNGITVTTTASSTTYTYTQPGTYVPKLLLSDGIACVVPIQGLDTIKVGSVTADFSFSPNNICQSGTVQFNDTVLFSVSPVASRSWTFGDGGTSSAHNPSHNYTGPGTYTVTMILQTLLGCSDTVVKQVTILPAPSVSAGPNQGICSGQNTSVQLQATGAVSYSWTPATGLSCTNCSNPVATPATATTYIVTGTGANGCTDTGQVSVYFTAPPTVSAGANQTICNGSTVQLLATGANTYSWTPSTGLSCTNCANPVASPSTTMTYTVTGTAVSGCIDTNQVTITVNPLPVINAGSGATICAGGSTQLQASGAASYVWSPATGLSCTACANPVATPATTTTYTVTGTSVNNCGGSGQVTVTVNPTPPVSAGPNQDICIGSSTQLQATGASTYSWTPSTGLSCTNCSNPVANPSVTTTYHITGTSASGCVDSNTIVITVNSLPTITAGADTSVCFGSSVQLQASGASTYSWSPSSTLSCANCPAPFAAPGSNATYTVIGADVNGCTDTDQVSVAVNQLPVVDAGPDQFICKLATAQLQASGATNYAWTPGSTLSCTNCTNPIASPTGTISYSVTGTDLNGCSNTDQVTVTIHPQPIIDAGPDETICRGQSVQLQASGGASYVWAPAATLSCSACPNPVASPVNDITYTVVGTDANGCQDSDKVHITVIQVQPFVVGPGDTLCKGESAQLSASGGNSYLWMPPTGLNDNQIANPVATPDVTTTYTLIVKQGQCFSDTSFVTVVVNPQPTVYAGADQTVIAGSSVMLFADATYATQYSWSPAEDLSCANCASPLALPKNASTTYTVNVSNEFGCKATDDVTIHIKCDNSQIFMANTFTPNADGLNDRYYPQGKGVSSIKRFRVYNRWGELMYDVRNIPANNETFGWDGTYKNETLKPDVYVYIVDAICDSGEPMQIKGDVSLVR